MSRQHTLTVKDLKEREIALQLDVQNKRHALAVEEASQTAQVRHDVLERMVQTAQVTVQDVLTTGAGGVKVRDLKTLPRHVARAVRKVKITNRTTGTGKDKETTQTVEVELEHHLKYDELIGRYLGLWGGESHQHIHIGGGRPPEQLTDVNPQDLHALKTSIEERIKTIDAEVLSTTTTKPTTAPRKSP